jgi:hypothetical protein
MRDPVIGYQVGQRVISLRSAISGPAFEAVIETVIVPTKGRRFVVIRDEQGRAHHRWFDEIEVIEAAPVKPAPVSKREVRERFEGSWDDLLAERGVTA